MALESWLTSLKADVSGVSDVQANIHAGFGRYVTDTPDVSGVSDSGGVVAGDTADTARENQTYQVKPNIHAGCTPDTPDTCKKINTEAGAANGLLSGDLLAATPTEPKRLFRPRGPWLSDTAQAAARTYHAHHFSCHDCIAAGRGSRYGQRCGTGAALWTGYQNAIK